MKLTKIARCIALMGVAGVAFAQSTPGASLERVEITGSSIKRLAAQGAVPLTVITSDDISQLGLNTAEQLLGSLSANSANVDNATSRNNVFGAEQDRLTGGSSFANLRGLGPTGTLVLLNGRRVSTAGMSGGSVDLNAIPMTAVDRVEVLRDGASAVYGTDAIGGVINFILKKDFTGVTVGASTTKPVASGGGTTRRAHVTGGFGSLEKDGFNFMASLALDKNDILRGIDRDWATGFRPELGLSPDTTSAPHANIIASAGTALTSAGSTVGATDATRYTNLNLLAIQGKCDQVPFGVPLAPNAQLWDKFGYTKANSQYRCATDYGRQFMLAPPKDAKNIVARGTFKLGSSNTGFVEFVSSRTDTRAEFTPFQFSSTSNAVTNYPVNGPFYLNLKNFGANEFDPTKPIAYRLRMWDWGYRTIENSSENTRLAAGIEGDIGEYFYKAGVSRGTSTGWSTLIDGYADTKKLVSILSSGKINPFLMPGQSQTAEAQALIEDSKVRGRIFGGDTSVTQLDGSISGKLMTLPAGSMEFATGFDLRRESYQFSGTQGFNCVSTFTVANTALANSVMGCPGNSSSPDDARDIKAVYGELLVPVTKALELTLQVRRDDYGQIGTTTNPKVAVRFQPLDSLVVRASANTGFRAPTAQQLRAGTQELALTGTFSDPERCAADATQCNRSSLPYRTGGNPTLKPETSKQSAIGFAYSPVASFQLSVDYWQVDLEDRIRNLSPAFMITNYSLFRPSFVRDAQGNVSYIQAGWVNAASSATKGVDLGMQYFTKIDGARVSASLSATRMLSHQERLIATAPLIEYVGEWTGTTLYLPWKITGNVGYKTEKWNTTVSFDHKSSYLDEDMSQYSSSVTGRRSIDSLTTYNLYTTYTGFKGVTLKAGVINLLDTKPPFTNHNVDGVVGAGWDPRVADPRGRTLDLSATYSF